MTKIDKNKFFNIILILENFLIVFIVLLVFLKIEKFKENLFYYLKLIVPYLSHNIFLLILSLVAALLIVILHFIIWKLIFKINNIEKNYSEISKIYFKIHFKRTFSPLGRASPILNLGLDIKKSSKIYFDYSIIILLGSSLFFIIFLYKIIIIFILGLLIYTIMLLLLKEILFKDIEFKEYFKTVLTALFLEIISFITFLFSLYIFNNNLDVYTALISYLIWVLVSSISPFLYGTGASESLATLFIYYLGFNPYLYLISLLYYRIITTYLPILGTILPDNFLKMLDK